jgi:flagellar basal-body rod modification protein FlgD
MEITGLSSAQSAKSTQALSQLTGNLDTFLTLLTTQLRNQDPLNPLDTEKFTSQLVEFASVEQSIETNRHLETLIGLQSAADRAGALAMLGRTVAVEGAVARSDGAGARWTYTLPDGAAAVQLTVLDAAGRPVAQGVGNTGRGAHDFVWDGRMSDGGATPAGTYSLVVRAVDAAGAAVDSKIETPLTVNGVSFDSGEVRLETAVGAVPLANVRRVGTKAGA